MKIAVVKNLLKSEIKRLAPALLLLVMLLLCWFVFLFRLGDPDAELNYPQVTSACMFAAAGLGVLIAALVVWLGFGHPSRRTDAFWRTRPIGLVDLVVVKFSLVAATVGVVGVVRWFAFGVLGMPAASAFSLLWLPLKVLLVPALLLLLLATSTGSWRRLSAVIGGVVAVVVICGMQSWLDGGVSAKALQRAHIAVEKVLHRQNGADGEGGLVGYNYARMGSYALLVVGGALLAALWCEYRTRRARWWAAILVVGVLLVGIAATLTPSLGTREVRLARFETDEMVGAFEPSEPTRRRFIVGGMRAERVKLSLDTSWWDGEGCVNFVGGSGDQLMFSGVDSTGEKRALSLSLESYSGGATVGDWQRYKERILSPLRMVRAERSPALAQGFEQLERGDLQMERGVPVEHFLEMGLTKGTVTGRLSAAQFIIERTGEVSLATSSKLKQGSGVVRFSVAKVVTVVGAEDGVETRTDVVRVDGVVCGLSGWQIVKGKLVNTLLMPAFQNDADGYHWSGMIGGLTLVHPDGVHALTVEPKYNGTLSAFGWTRSRFYFGIPLSGVKGVDGSDDFPPITAGDVAKMRLILTRGGTRKQIKVTIPPTEWQLSDQ